MLDRFQGWYERRHGYAREWKRRTGGKVVGTFCTYVPDEMLTAAGILPVRILGSHEPQDVTEPHIFGMFCPFCRDCLAQGLKGRYDYLDGIAIGQSCLHIRQAFSSWQKHVPVDFSYYLCMPHKVASPRAKPFLRGELEDFRAKLEAWTGRKITDEALREGIAVVNRQRMAMRKVYEARRATETPVTGLESMYMVVSGQWVDRLEHAEAVEKTLATLPSRKLDRKTGARLMIIGSEDDDTEFVKMAESVGATFVTDDHCTGTRAFWDLTDTAGDPLTAIAARYVDRTPCPSKDWEGRRRFDRILSFAREWKVQGAILMQQKFCDPHEIDFVALKTLLDKNGVPTLFLEFDVTVPMGQFRIRVEAFLEMIGQEDLF